MGVAKVHSAHGPQALLPVQKAAIVLELLKEEDTLLQIASNHQPAQNTISAFFSGFFYGFRWTEFPAMRSFPAAR